MRASVVAVSPLEPAARAIAGEMLEGIADLLCLSDVDPADRESVLRAATVVLAQNLKGLSAHDLQCIARARLLQFLTAGIDYVPLATLPPGLPVASNAGAYAAPMAEHALAMALAACKRIVVEHEALRRGQFNQFVPNRMLAGGTCGIFGFGGIGEATARLMRSVGMRIHAVNRSGRGADLVDWMGGPDRLDDLLAAADVLVIAAPLTRATLGRIGAAELARMRPDAILVNLARGEIIDEAALCAHLRSHPRFTACIDAWWVEPIRHGQFRMDQPFMALPNVIASPHNSATVPATRANAVRQAIGNVRRAIAGQPIDHLVAPDDRFL